MPDYETDRIWADRWIPKIIEIVGPHLLSPTTFEQDVEQVADLMILKARDMRVGARIRRNGYYAQYPNDFTIRCERNSGAKTELRKIVEGWGDWFFYGHEYDNEIWPWWLINLDAFRAHLALEWMTWSLHNKASSIRFGKRPNSDHETSLAWFDRTSFPSDPPLLIAEASPRPPFLKLF